MKRALSILLCLMLVLSMATTAFADDEVPAAANDVTVTINNAAVGSTYALYRILESNSDGTAFGYATNDKYNSIYYALFSSTDDSAIINGFTSAGKSGAPALAESFYNAILAYNVTATNKIEADATVTITADTNSVVVPQGYYLIVETQNGTDKQDTFSLYMMDTAGKNGLTISSKESAPTLEKTVYNDNDSKNDSDHQSWSEHANYDVGDTVSYKIIVKPSGSYASYKTYHIAVEDTMDAGLKYNGDLTVHVGNLNGPDITEFFTVEREDDSGFKVSGDLKKVTYKIKTTNDAGEEVEVERTLSHNSDVVFKYTATLTDAAKVGDEGNKNGAKLFYQNNPYVEYTPETELGETPEDETVVHTFKLIVHKVDENNEPLEGIGFTLYKYDDVTTDSFVALGEKHSDAEGNIIFNGLDEGIYKLEETDLAGKPYNKADDIEFHIHATYDNSNPGHLVKLEAIGDNNAVLGSATYDPTAQTTGEDDGIDTQADTLFTVTLNKTQADLEVTIVNRTGTELPETGGMGTTLIYIAGGILVLAAVILLVTKKRMANAE